MKSSNAPSLVAAQYALPNHLQARIALHERFTVNRYDWARWVLDQIAPADGAVIIEVGGGTGRLWKVNADRLRPGWNITLSDQSAGMVEQAHALLAGLGHPFRFEVCPADRIPRPDASADIVIANHMLYHVPDLPAALREFRRVLKPDGVLFAATNGAGHLREIDALYSAYRGVDTRLGMSLSFTLERGGEALRPFFPDLRIVRREDSLRVDDAAALADYILSMDGDPAERPRLIAHLQAAIDAAGGALHIGKDSGMFVARAQPRR